MAEITVTLSPMHRRAVHELRALGQKLFLAFQSSQSGHMLSATMAYIRSLAASALESDPHDITWKQIALVLKESHKDIIILGECHLLRASQCIGIPGVDLHDLAFGGMLESMAAEQALEIADLLLRADCRCCDQERLKLACQGYRGLLIGAYLAGNIMEACRVKWIVDRPEIAALPFFTGTVKHKGLSFVQESIGNVDDIMGNFRSLEGLVEVPTAWRTSLEGQPTATCSYPAHISCQATQVQTHLAFKDAVTSELINCGTYKAQPVFVIRDLGVDPEGGRRYGYSVYTCRLEETKGKMEVLLLRELEPTSHRYTLGAVSGNMLYLTSFREPLFGALLGVDLTKDVPTKWTMNQPLPALERDAETMVSLGGDLYVYGGSMKDAVDRLSEGFDDRHVFSDLLVARAKDGRVNQPWTCYAVKPSGRQPPKRLAPCVFGHRSPEERLSLYLFSGVHATAKVGEPVKDLWKLDLASGQWSELEQYGTRPCARMMPHGAFMSPNGQKALIAGGNTAFICEHVLMQRDPHEYTGLPLPDLFELDLKSTCWVQIAPKGKKWTSAFTTCAGGYLASNHIGLIGLARCEKAATPSRLAWGSVNDWSTAVNIRFQRGRDTVNNILAAERHGLDRDRVAERIIHEKLERLCSAYHSQDAYMLALLEMDRSKRACTILTQHLMAVAIYGYTPQHKIYHHTPDLFGGLLKGKHEVIAHVQESLKFQFKEPWLHPDLCPFNVGPHWLGGYNEVSTGVKLTELPSKKQQTSGAPWFESMHHVIRSLPTARAAVEYFRLLLPPWDAQAGSGDWVKSAFPSDWMPAALSEAAVLVYISKSRPTSSTKHGLYPIYIMAVSGCLFSAMLLDMRAPTGCQEPWNPNWPFHLLNLKAIVQLHMCIMSCVVDMGSGLTYQCSFCGKGWSSEADSGKQKPKVCECQMARYCSQDCQYRHWGLHKPVCKAARQPGGITQEQALAFMLS